ncbi:Dolichyl-phosphate-mannose-protein mannosyltransferase-domain-containing protein [Dipodascopsis tothii]|uniref:Dolichyl-phosphate-mannose-protein mannosyltransferase-domain-containing protein n=1 Tax=Dipodascopsis tothii TaxID=44089 RepID=UPI0034CDC2DF
MAGAAGGSKAAGAAKAATGTRKSARQASSAPTADAAATEPAAKAAKGADTAAAAAAVEVAEASAESRRSAKRYRAFFALTAVLAFYTRFYKLNHPDQVVFDEVHFGKFASYYLQRTYFFDVHPPFGKLLYAFVGWAVGYDGSFLFENIGDGYSQNHVPYVAYRSLPALFGALTVPLVFLIMKESGYSLPACIVSTALVLFDNGHITQTRLILLDSTLILWMVCALYAYVRFSKLRNQPYTYGWWKWLMLTGLSLSCTISTKYVGVFTFLTVGIAVAVDLWDLLDVSAHRLTLAEFAKHFCARAFALIVVPFLCYLFWFAVHFAILNKSGPGDDFMSPEFQETLGDNALTLESYAVNYYDVVTFQHKDTKTYLHSHPDRYPLRYEDGRISSQGQQVTGYPYRDANNEWEILPAVAFGEDDRLGHAVHGGDLVQLRHVRTNTILLSHDVASPYYPTNQEFTTVSVEDAAGPRHNDTLFEIRLNNGKTEPFRTKAGLFKLIHNPSKVAMWTHDRPLPDWAFKQQEINGNKNSAQASNTWYADEIVGLTDETRLSKEEKQIKKLPFLKKYAELQLAMFRHNNALTASHPYASFPPEWPFILRGVSFWTNNENRAQIYLIGNPFGWWFATCMLAVLAGIMVSDQLTRRRKVYILPENVRSRLYKSAGFFLVAWAAHYFPFYVMGRQLFLHHYLPAHLISSLCAGAVLDFFFTSPGVYQVVKAPPVKSEHPDVTVYPQTSLSSAAVAGLVVGLTVGIFLFFTPFTYGDTGLDVDQVLRRKWLNFDLHFAK